MVEICTAGAIEAFKSVLYNKGWYGEHSHYPFKYDNELMTFVDADNELEYQIRDYPNHMLESILVRLIDDTEHIYIEFFDCDYDNIYDMIYDAISDETIEELTTRYFKKRMAQKGNN